MKKLLEDCLRYETSELMDKKGRKIVNCSDCGYSKGNKCLFVKGDN